MKTRPLSPRSILYTIVWKSFKNKNPEFSVVLRMKFWPPLTRVYRLFKTQPLPTFLTVSYYPQPHRLCFSSVDLLPISKTASGPLCLLFPLPKCCSSWRLPDFHESVSAYMLPPLETPSLTICYKEFPLITSLSFISFKACITLWNLFLSSFSLFLPFSPSQHRGCLRAEPLSFHHSLGIPGIYLTAASKVRTQ